jgi:orotidine-5'-phosphate decarboxylase
MRSSTTEPFHFADRLTDLVKERGPICAGIDPRLGQMPKPQDEAAAAQWGEEVAALLADKVACLKPQIAFFQDEWTAVDQIGIAAMNNGGAMVIGDCKRGDIGSTAKAYADRILGYASAVNAVTLNPYLGRDSIQPFLDVAADTRKGVFILVKTSNPGSADIQNLPTDHAGKRVWEIVADMVNDLGKPYIGKSGRSAVGAVVGLTNTVEEVKRCRELMPDAWFLMPGYGAQGGSPEVYKAALDRRGGGVLVSASRSLTLPWRGEAPARWKKRIEIELKVMQRELAVYA